MWLIFTLASAILFSITNIIEKHVISDELKDSKLSISIYGISYFVIGLVMLIIAKTDIILNASFAIAISAGISMGLARWLYYKSLKREEVSRVIPLYLITPLFVLILGIIFLNETFTLQKYLGIFLLILGAMSISIRIDKGKKRITPIIYLILFSTFLFAVRDVLSRHISQKLEFIALFFGLSMGVILVSLVLLVIHHPAMIHKKKKILGIKHLILLSLMNIIAHLLFLKALTLQKAALVSALVNSKVFLVFVIAIAFSKYNPKIIREHLKKETIILKVIGTILLFIGAILIIL